MRTTPLASLITLSLALAAGPALAQQNIDKVFGGITAESGQEYGSLESVNGGITVREGATVRAAETVNGGISIADRARVGSAETVNGGINLGDAATAGSLETVNGGIRGRKGVQVGGNAETVNGGLNFDGAKIAGSLTTTNGDITLDATHVRGGILVEKPSSGWWNSGNSRKPRIVIGPDSVVDGALVFEREVELFVHASARIGKVTGATARAYTDKLPPRE